MRRHNDLGVADVIRFLSPEGVEGPALLDRYVDLSREIQDMTLCGGHIPIERPSNRYADALAVALHFVRVTVAWLPVLVLAALILYTAEMPWQISLLIWLAVMCVSAFRYVATRQLSEGTVLELVATYWYSFWFVLLVFTRLGDIFLACFVGPDSIYKAFDKLGAGYLFGIFLFMWAAGSTALWNGFGFRAMLRDGLISWGRVAFQFLSVSVGNFRISMVAVMLYYHLNNVAGQGSALTGWLNLGHTLILQTCIFVFLLTPAFYACMRPRASVARWGQFVLACVGGLLIGGCVFVWCDAMGLLGLMWSTVSGEEYTYIERSWFSAMIVLWGAGLSVHIVNRHGFRLWGNCLSRYALWAAQHLTALAIVLGYRFALTNRGYGDSPASLRSFGAELLLYAIGFLIVQRGTAFAVSRVSSVGSSYTRALVSVLKWPSLSGQYEGVGFVLSGAGARGPFSQLLQFSRALGYGMQDRFLAR